MPRLKNKPLFLDETHFIDWLQEVYYYRMMDQGISPARTLLMISTANDEARKIFLEQLRAQMQQFELSFPLTKLPWLYTQALRQVSVRPARVSAAG
jgi:hypothetical protein